MGNQLSKLIIKLIGWKEVGTFPEGKKFVVVAAPHTSWWDFILGHLYYSSIGRKVSFMVKGKYFFFPLTIVLRWLGAIPVYTNSKISLPQQMIAEFKKRDEFLLNISPEATRKLTKRWKKGFLFIANGANVPIVLGYLDFEKKTFGTGGLYYPCDDMDADLIQIKRFYKDKIPKHPELFSSEE